MTGPRVDQPVHHINFTKKKRRTLVSSVKVLGSLAIDTSVSPVGFVCGHGGLGVYVTFAPDGIKRTVG